MQNLLLKRLMFPSLLVLLSLFFNEQILCQINFSYDFNGNRTNRVLLLAKEKDTITNGNALHPTFLSVPKTLNDTIGDVAISLWPNPNGGKFTITSDNREISELITVELFSLKGEKVFSEKFSRSIIEIDIRNQSSGSYILKLYSGKHSVTYKVIKQ